MAEKRNKKHKHTHRHIIVRFILLLCVIAIRCSEYKVINIFGDLGTLVLKRKYNVCAKANQSSKMKKSRFEKNSNNLHGTRLFETRNSCFNYFSIVVMSMGLRFWGANVCYHQFTVDHMWWFCHYEEEEDEEKEVPPNKMWIIESEETTIPICYVELGWIDIPSWFGVPFYWLI